MLGSSRILGLHTGQEYILEYKEIIMSPCGCRRNKKNKKKRNKKTKKTNPSKENVEDRMKDVQIMKKNKERK